MAATRSCTLQEAGHTSCAPDLHREASRGRTFSRRPEGTLHVGTLEWRQWQGPRATAGGVSTATERPAGPQWRPGQNARWSGGGASRPQGAAGAPGHLPPAMKMHLVAILGKKRRKNP